MKKRGFTLVELLGVFSLTAIILLVAVPTVTSMLKKAKHDQYDSFKQDIFLATEAYIGVNHADFYELKNQGGKAYINLGDLLASDFLSSTIVDPNTGKKLSQEANYTIIVTTNSKKTYDYELIETTVYHPYEVGDIITYDPGDGVVREWIVMESSGTNLETVKIILNENIGSDVAWCVSGTSNTCSADGVLAAMSLATSKWIYVDSANLKLATSSDLVALGCSTSTNTCTTSSYPWIYSTSYWTSTAGTVSTTAIRVGSNGYFGENSVSNLYGIRPVIILTKYK
ncbi:MAG: type II secretion system protein [Bacilli bacterium]|nr:type II secretion system protein [Bacilli bacterium]